MGEGEAVDRRRRPQFFDERGVPESIEPPEEMVGVYTFARDPDTPDADRTYTRKGILTTEGWVPPASKILVHTVAKTGEGPNDLGAIPNYTVGKATRVAIDPRELRTRLSVDGEIINQDDTSAAIRSPYRDDVRYYIPEGLDIEQLAQYIRPCVRPAMGYYLDEHDGEHPSRDQLAAVLVQWYGISEEAASRSVELEIGGE